MNLYEGEDVIGQVTVFVGLRGDTNLDGRLDSKDVSLLQSILGCNGTGKKYTEVPEFANFSDEERNLSLVLANYTSVDAETSTLPDDMYKKINSKDASELLKRLANINVEKIDVGNDYEYAQDKENVVILSYKGNLTNITELNIPETINGMKVIAINGLGPLVNVKKVKIPSSIKEISEDVFLDFCNLQEIEVDSNNTVYRSESGILYRGKALSYCPRNINLTSLSISDDVTKIESCAFFSNNNLNNIEIGKNVSDIVYSSFENSKIEKLSVDEENRTFFSKENTILTRDSNELVVLPAILPETFTIPVETKKIDLYNKKINKMIIPQNASIEILSLTGCEFNTIEVDKNSYINAFDLWGSTTIKEFKARDSKIMHFFGGSANIDEFEIKDTEIKSASFGELVYIKNIYIDNRDSSASVDLFDSKVDNMNLFGNNVSVGCYYTSLQSLELNGLNSSGIFYGSYNLKNVKLQDVNNLDCSAFEYCTSLENVVVSKKTLLRTGCFRNCTNLKTVVIEGRNIIDKTMFEGCKSLTTLKIREGSLIDKDAIPENVKVIFIDENGNEV